MDVIKKIDALREERGWTKYRLAEEATLTYSTLSAIYARNPPPKFEILEMICNALVKKFCYPFIVAVASIILCLGMVACGKKVDYSIAGKTFELENLYGFFYLLIIKFARLTEINYFTFTAIVESHRIIAFKHCGIYPIQFRFLTMQDFE